MSANDKQVGGTHYKREGVTQPWDYVLQHELGYLEGNIVKYVTRHKKKNGIEDLKKARHYLDKLIEVEEFRLSLSTELFPGNTISDGEEHELNPNERG